ncbi:MULTISPECIES: hypothetical protein [Pseudomonas]|uniref:hypothetical protein n=1 Tax=Pseudomonas TaxID=286 RepID=UPI002912D89B|nr:MULTISPECIES: hypothetical protein [Pseudomonas]MDU8545722.1 hypothetical protein [Pseudomonas syringae group sp. J248-6]WPP02589.1 hypothetical protein SFA35_26485 [Pseudomonas sp. HR96]
MKIRLSIIAALLALSGCNDSETNDRPTPSADRGCLPVSTNSMPGYTPSQLAKADFCLPDGEVGVDLVVSDIQSWDASNPSGTTRVAFSPKIASPQIASVVFRSDKNTYRFTLKPDR